jgi:hypothetical protein
MKMQALVVVALLAVLMAGVAGAQNMRTVTPIKTDLTPVPKVINMGGPGAAMGPDDVYYNMTDQGTYYTSYVPPNISGGQILDQGLLKSGATVNGFGFIAQNADAVPHNVHLYVEIYEDTSAAHPGTLYQAFDLGVQQFPAQTAYEFTINLQGGGEFTLGRGCFGYSVYADMADSDLECQWWTAYDEGGGSGDWFWEDNDPATAGFDGNYYFGGYPANPQASFAFRLYGIAEEVPVPSISAYGIGALIFVLLGSAVVLIARKKATVSA